MNKGYSMTTEKEIVVEETVTISKVEYDALVDDANWLRSLESAGVDNWNGYDFAREIHQENHPEDYE